MANMSYCRFRNTLEDLADCYASMEEDASELSEEERRARARIIRLCAQIADDYREEVES